MKAKLLEIYKKLYARFGPQAWWPADSAFEVMVGAILTQNTSWQNVERAIANLKKARCLSVGKLAAVGEKRLAKLLRPAGYFNIKARRLKNFIRYLQKNYKGNLKAMARVETDVLRRELLSVNGIGEETADSILLYALGQPVFVIDAYTKRIFSRHNLSAPDADYQALQRLFVTCLERDAQFFNEYHALIVRVGKEFCKKSKALCAACPLEGDRRTRGEERKEHERH